MKFYCLFLCLCVVVKYTKSQNLVAENITYYSCSLRWQGEPKYQTYRIEVTNNDDFIQVNKNLRCKAECTILLTDLSPSTNFESKITCNSCSLKIQKNKFRTEDLPTINNLNSANVTQFSFVINWDAVPDFLQNQGLYQVQIWNHSTYSIKDTQFKFNNGLPFTTYNIIVFTKYKNYTGKPAYITITTQSEVPGPPQNLTPEFSHDLSVSFSWKPPNIKIESILNYTIEIKDLGALYGEACNKTRQHITQKIEKPYFNVKLRPFHKYKVSVFAETAAGVGQSLTGIIKTTGFEIQPPDIQIKDKINVITEDSYNLSKILIVKPKCDPDLIKYKIIIMEINLDNKKEEKMDYKDDDNLLVTKLLNNLKPWHKYNISVTVISDLGNKTWFESFTTPQAFPGPPQNLTYHSSNHLNVSFSWKPPKTNPESNLNYTIQIKDLGVRFGEACNKTRQNISQNTEKPYFNVTLRPFHTYNVSVFAETAAGLGRSLTEIINTTGSEIRPPVIQIEDKITKNTQDFYNLTKNLIVKPNCDPGPILEYEIAILAHNLWNKKEEKQTTIIKAGDNLRFNKSLEDLKAWHNYNISVTAISNLENKTVNTSFETPQGFPGPPIIDVSYLENSKELYIEWKEPVEKRGEIKKYNIHIQSMGVLNGGLDCEPKNLQIDQSTNELFYSIEASPYYQYKVEVNAETIKGVGRSADTLFNTSSAEPDGVENINYCISQFNYTTSLEVFYKQCRSNGYFKKNEVEVTGLLVTKQNESSWTISPESEYNINILTVTNSHTKLTSDIIRPSVPHISNKIEPPKLNEETNQIEFMLKTSYFEGFYENLYFALLLTNDSKLSSDETTIWKQYGGKFCKNDSDTKAELPKEVDSKLYIGGGYLLTPFQILDPDSERIITMCSIEYSENQNCIPVNLAEDMEYYLIIRVFTPHFYGDSQKLTFRTGTYGNYTSLILGITLSLFILIAFIVLAIYFLLRDEHPIFSQFQNITENFQKLPSDSTAESHKCMPSEFPIYVKNLKNAENDLKTQFNNLAKLTQEFGASCTTEIAQLQQNRKKNRYINILPYDSTRVILPDDEYINANYIKGKSGYVEYIACQGPLEKTCETFWHMVVNEKVSIIVMVTQFVENRKEKCFAYFPSLNASMIEDDMTITCTEEELCGDYCLRTLEIENEEKIVSVKHFQFLNWPDFGVPTTTESLVKFVKDVRKTYQSGKILVHCSAGVGRTGTFITLDIGMTLVDKQQEIDIFNIVLNLRKQRCLMVQTLAQYEYIHDCLANYINFEQESKI